MVRIYIAGLFLLFCGALVAGEGPLPEPVKSGGDPLFEAIEKRSSAPQTGFPGGSLSGEDIATLLWAATGPNRNGRGWTVPTALGQPPYCKVYYLDHDGAYRYDWNSHSLIRVTDVNLLPVLPNQQFAKQAPAMLILVADGETMAEMKDSPYEDEFDLVLVGAMSQNVYLAGGSLGVGVRFIYSIDRAETAKALCLAPEDKAIAAMVLGRYQPESAFTVPHHR